MWQKILKFLTKIFKKGYVQLIFYFLLLMGIFALAGAFKSGTGFWEYLVEIITDQGTVAFFFAGVVAISASVIVKSIKRKLEESNKIIDDHHEIIHRYNGHVIDKVEDITKDFYSRDGMFMELHHTRHDKPAKNHIKDIYSSEYESMEKEITLFNEHNVLLLPTVNVYTNIEGICKVNIIDKTDVKELPPFIIGNGTEFLKAHLYSQTSNNLTIRLDDINVDGQNVTLNTSRTYYYHMLLTNRCMDYKLDCDMSVREIYEFNKRVSSLPESKLSNQIGINGMIITKDGYLLVEKRDHTKTTWKNKFAQPISLALKASDLNLPNGKMGESVEEANKQLLGVIKKTMRDNFGLLEEDYESLDLSKNFLGLARDLLEGGKPNLYFVVTVNYNKDEFVELLRENAKVAKEPVEITKYISVINKELKGIKPEEELEEIIDLIKENVKIHNKKETIDEFVKMVKKYTKNLNDSQLSTSFVEYLRKTIEDNKELRIKPIKPLKTGKLSSQYYLISYKDVKISFDYSLKVLRKNVIRVPRIVFPRCSKRQERRDLRAYNRACRYNKYLEYDCGEALLVTLSYLELCRKRIDAIKDIKIDKEEK